MSTRLTRRRFLQLSAISVTGAALAACAPAAQEAAPAASSGGAAAPASDVVEIEFMNWWGSHREALMDEIIENFHDTTDGVVVVNSVQPWDGRVERTATAIASSTPPSLIMTERIQTYQFANEGLIIPIDDHITASGIDPDTIFYTGEINNQRWQGQLYSFPLPTGGGNTGQYFFNKEHLREAGVDPDNPPKTWQELEAAGQAITVGEALGLDRMFMQLGDGPVGFGQWIYTNNGQFVSDDGKTIVWNSPEGVETLEWMVNYTNEVNGGIENTREFRAGTSDTSADYPFYEDKETILFTGVWQFGHLQATDPEMWEDTERWGVALKPYNGNNSDATHAGIGGLSGSWGYVIPTSLEEEKQDAAYQWLEFFGTSPDGGCQFLFNQGRPATVIECNNNPEYFAANPYWQVVLDALATDISIPITPVQAEINDIIGGAVDEAYFGVQEPQAALDQAAEKAQTILDDFWAG